MRWTMPLPITPADMIASTNPVKLPVQPSVQPEGPSFAALLDAGKTDAKPDVRTDDARNKPDNRTDARRDDDKQVARKDDANKDSAGDKTTEAKSSDAQSDVKSDAQSDMKADAKADAKTDKAQTRTAAKTDEKSADAADVQTTAQPAQPLMAMLQQGAAETAKTEGEDAGEEAAAINAAGGKAKPGAQMPAGKEDPATAGDKANPASSKPAQAAKADAPVDAKPGVKAEAKPEAVAASPPQAPAQPAAPSTQQAAPAIQAAVQPPANGVQPAAPSSAPQAVLSAEVQKGTPAPNMNHLAVEISSRAQSGARQFDIRLDPPELGRVDVRLSIDATGKAQAHMTADQPQTLELLQKDSSVLTRALRDAGLDVSQDGLNFSLKSQNGQAEHQQREPGQRTASFTARAVAANENTPQSISFRAANGGLDIHV